MWTQIGGPTRVEYRLPFITRSPQSPVATIFISSRSTIRKSDARTAIGLPSRPDTAIHTVLRLPLASRGAIMGMTNWVSPATAQLYGPAA